MIARNLPRLPGIDTALIDGTPIPAMVRLNTLAAYQTLVEKSFDYAPAFAFDIEFDRIAKRKKLSEKTYRHHFKAAKLQDEQIHALDVSKLDFFKRYVNGRMNFHLDSKATIDIEFHRLAVHRSWGSRKFLQRWCELMQEARLLVGVPVAAPSHATNTTAPSETSGVQLPSSTLSDAETSTFTSSVTEHSPAPSTSSYFSSFVSRGYKPDPSVGFEEEFERLSLHEGWLPCDPERVRQWRSALEGELASQFGAADKLTSWQTLCMELGIDPPPTSITQCKKVSRISAIGMQLSYYLTIFPVGAKNEARKHQGVGQLSAGDRETASA
jgi:hypothetical protein